MCAWSFLCCFRIAPVFLFSFVLFFFFRFRCLLEIGVVTLWRRAKIAPFDQNRQPRCERKKRRHQRSQIERSVIVRGPVLSERSVSCATPSVMGTFGWPYPISTLQRKTRCFLQWERIVPTSNRVCFPFLDLISSLFHGACNQRKNVLKRRKSFGGKNRAELYSFLCRYFFRFFPPLHCILLYLVYLRNP